MSLYAVKNDKGEWLYSDEYNDWVGLPSLASFYDTFEDADDDIECWELSNAHVVELTEKPAPIVVSEEEAEMLEQAKNPTFRPSSVITTYSSDHDGWDLTSDIEDRMMRAYVLGYTVKKPKRYNVKVPHAKDSIYFKHTDGGLDATYTNGSDTEFTAAEIDQYGLQDCEKVEVKE